jgi:hypothetical protein
MRKILCFRAKLLHPKPQEETSGVEKIRASIKDVVPVLQIVQYYYEEPFGTQLEIIMTFGLPPLVYPFYQLAFRGT